GKKSWFMFDEEMVALGAGITGTGNTAIETTVEKRKLNAAGDNDFTVDGEAALPGAVSGSAPALSETLTDVSWAHLEGSAANSDIGYYFPGKATINAVREARSGNWNEVGTSNQAAAASYLTM